MKMFFDDLYMGQKIGKEFSQFPNLSQIPKQLTADGGFLSFGQSTSVSSRLGKLEEIDL